ncbi:MAG TPA: sulfatase [Anaerolineae bacterium]|nr:sulfatase [Anaerolineae bacterium]HNU04590.1 sulfatase [Anaerolineae bacterium]
MKRNKLVLLILAFSLLLSGCVSNRGLLSDLGVGGGSRQPNIVMILTDDQDLLLDSMDYMPQVDALLAKRGTTFSNFFVSLPLCCPARAMVLRGEYSHNNGILTNLWPTGGFAKAYTSGFEYNTIATALHDAGYRTALIGKYLNGYPNSDNLTYIPPGWDEWWAPITDSAYGSYDYKVNHNGVIEEYGSAPEDYITDVISDQGMAFIRQTTTVSPTQPFFMALNFYAPHSPARPAPRHKDLFPDVQAPRRPSFNEEDVSDKPPFMQTAPPLTEEQIQEMDTLYRRRLQSLQAVDEAVATLVQTLEETGQLDNTYIFFLSDNGFHMGEHRMLSGKGMPYEEDIHLPLVVRGPGVRKNAVRDDLATMIDMAPTFAAIAGAQMTNSVDGRSLLPLLGIRWPGLDWRNSLLLEHYTAPSSEENKSMSESLEPPDPGDLQQETLAIQLPDYAGIRTTQYKYIQRLGAARELYDLIEDPYELNNLWSSADPQFQAELTALLESYQRCVGATCRAIEAQPAPKFRLIAAP